MSKFKVWFVIFIIVLCPVMVNAHPGRLDLGGCHTCRTNCSKCGLSNGQYHCHGGSSFNNKSSNTTKKSVKKKRLKQLIQRLQLNMIVK